MDGSPSISVDALLAQASWLRRLAAHLVVDPEVAEDLVQDTWQRALENPPAAGVDVRGWLARVLRNRAINRDREADVRRWHEKSASRSDEWSSADVEERVRLQRRLAEAILELEEPYRSAITLRYFEGMTPQEIARRQHATSEAIRQRLSRGRDMLRARLDREFNGDREAWCLILVGLLWKGSVNPFAASPAAKIATVGGIAAALSLVALFIWNSLRTGTPGTPVAATSVAATAPPPPAGGSRLADDRSSGAREALGSPIRAIDPERDLHGVVLDPAGRPIAEARIVVLADESCGYSWDPEAPIVRRIVTETRTDGLGAFSVAVARGRPFDLEASAAGYATTTLGYRYAGENVTVRIGAGATLTGRVTQASSGSPVPGARIEVRTEEGTLEGAILLLREGETDETGRFRFENLPAIPVTLRVTPRAAGAPASRELVLESGGTQDVELGVEEGKTIRGRVLDKDTRDPIAEARVGELGRFHRSGLADEHGEYAYPGIRGSASPITLLARAPGYSSAVRVFRSVSNVDDLPDRYDFELTRGTTVRGRVVDSHGVPVPGAYVAAVSNIHPSNPQAVRIWGRCDDRGRFELLDVSRDLAFTLLARNEGSGALVESPTGDPGADVREVEDLVLPQASSLFGSVVDEDGHPVPNWAVILEERTVVTQRDLGGAPEDRARLDASLARSLTRRSARTDDRGRFAFVDLAGGDYSVQVRVPDAYSQVSMDVSIPPGGTKEGVSVTLPVLESISGRVTDAEGQGLAGITVLVNGDNDSAHRTYSADSDATGAFSVNGLRRDTYRIEVVPEIARARRPETPPFLGQVRSRVPAGTKDLRIGLPAAVLLRGRVLDAEDRPAKEVTVIAQAPGQDEKYSAVTDVDGTFTIAVPLGVSFNLETHPAPDSVSVSDGIARRTSVLPTDPDVILRLPR